jgi:hypothetical protein
MISPYPSSVFYAFLLLPDDKRKKRGHYKCYDGSRELFVALEAVNSGKMNAGQASVKHCSRLVSFLFILNHKMFK